VRSYAIEGGCYI